MVYSFYMQPQCHINDPTVQIFNPLSFRALLTKKVKNFLSTSSLWEYTVLVNWLLNNNICFEILFYFFLTYRSEEDISCYYGYG